MDVAYSSATETKARRRWGLPDHLPDLRGRWLTLYTIAWVILLALAIVGPIWGQYQLSGYYQKPAWLPYGFAVSSSSGIQIVAVSSGEAQQAGVRAGDRIIAIDGWKLPLATSNSSARPHA